MQSEEQVRQEGIIEGREELMRVGESDTSDSSSSSDSSDSSDSSEEEG